MVMFVCNMCGENMKKAKVEEHYKFKCRACEVVSCLDCGKDFWGNDYVDHIKCISEAEKYQGVPTDYTGDKKQESWIRNVSQVISGYKGNPRVSSLLQRSIEQPNLPRKQKKFINFCKSAFHEHDPKVLDEAWSIIEKASKPTAADVKGTSDEKSESSNTPSVTEEPEEESPEKQPSKKHKKLHKSQESLNGSAEASAEDDSEGEDDEEKTKNGVDEDADEDGPKETEKQKKKRLKQEKLAELSALQNSQGKKLSKKQLKRLREESISLELASNEANSEPAADDSSAAVSSKKGEKKNKKGKSKQLEQCDEEEQVDDPEEDIPQNLNGVVEDVEELTVKMDRTFNWHKAIKQALKAEDDKSLSIKKLRKKVINEFMDSGAAAKISNENEIYALFDKKLHSYPKVKIQKERATLVS